MEELLTASEALVIVLIEPMVVSPRPRPGINQKATGVICRGAMDAKHVTPILNVSDIGESFAWFAKWGWKKCWDWGTPPGLGRWGRGNARSVFAGARKGAAAREPTPRHLEPAETKPPTRACGCRCGWRALTRGTASAWPLGWMSFSRRPICRGTHVRCICGIRRGTCFE